MAEESKAKKSGKQDEGQQTEKTLLFELEHIALEGREALFEVVKNSMESRDVDFNVPAFSRYCVEDVPKHFVPRLLEAFDMGNRSEDKMLKEIEEGMNKFWQGGEFRERPGFSDLLAKTKDSGFRHVAVTSLPEKTAEEVLSGLDLDKEDMEIHSFSGEEKGVAGTDILMQAAMDRKIDLNLSLGLVTSSQACKAGMTADIYCIVVPDRFTEFQDFGGAAMIVDQPSDIDVDELVATFYQHIES